MPHCLFWCLWWERNARCFEDCERSILDIKFFFFRTLLEWSLVLPSYSCFSLPDLIDRYNLGDLCNCSTLPVYLVGFFNKISYITYQKKNFAKKWKHLRLRTQSLDVSIYIASTSYNVFCWTLVSLPLSHCICSI